MKVVWETNAFKELASRIKAKTVFTGDPTTGLRYKEKVKAKIREMKTLVRHEPLPPPPPNRHKATLVGSPGAGDVIIYELDMKIQPNVIRIRGVLSYIPDPIP